MPVTRKYRRETSEISGCLKYIIFVVNIIFWLIGISGLAIGIWAWTEKDVFTNFSKATNLALLDPAFVLILVGAMTFLIAFTGCVGALRENTNLLSLYSIFLIVLLIMELICVVLVFFLKDKGWIKEQATQGLRTFITHYREDSDQQNLFDWIQGDWLNCCGIDGPQDWDYNIYFNCSSASVGSSEACGVPFSCCKARPNDHVKNKACGYHIRSEKFTSDRQIYEKGCLRAYEDWLEAHLVSVASSCVGVTIFQNFDVSKIIHEMGCLQAGELWMERNLIFLTSSAIFLAFLQILGICFAQNLRADIMAQKSKWKH